MKEDVQAYVKYELSRPKATAATSVGSGNGGGLQVIAAPKVDFSKFGEVEEIPLSRIQKISGPNLHRNWVTIPRLSSMKLISLKWKSSVSSKRCKRRRRKPITRSRL